MQTGFVAGFLAFMPPMTVAAASPAKTATFVSSGYHNKGKTLGRCPKPAQLRGLIFLGQDKLSGESLKIFSRI